MPKAAPAVVAFNTGLLSKQVAARVDLGDQGKKYLFGCQALQNFIPLVEGPLVKRPGSLAIAPAKYADRETRMVPFSLSNAQSYMLEFGDGYMRVHRNFGTILDSSTVEAITAVAFGATTEFTTFLAHSYAVDDHVYVTGLTQFPELNNQFHQVAAVTPNSFIVNLDTSSLTPTAVFATSTKVYEVATTYGEAQAVSMKYEQSVDVLYIVAPAHSYRKLSRLADDNWTIEDVWTAANVEDPNNDGFWRWPAFAELEINLGNTVTMSMPIGPHAPGATVVVTASAATFTTNDVGRFIKFQLAALEYGFGYVSAFNSATSIDIVVKSPISATLADGSTPIKYWAWSAFDHVNGWPRAIALFDNRLYPAGTTEQPQHLWGSVAGDFENMRPYSDDGSGGFTIAADSAFSVRIDADKQNEIEWLLGQDSALFAGTRGREFAVTGASIEQAIAPGNIFAKPKTASGSRENVAAVAVDSSIIFAHRAGRRLEELALRVAAQNELTSEYRTDDLTRLSREILLDRVKGFTYQQEPARALWGWTENGLLRSLTFERDEAVSAWAEQVLGGTDSKVISAAVIPSADDDEDEVWMCVRRTVNGASQQLIEVMSDYWDREQSIESALFMDAAIGYSGAQMTVTTVTPGTPTDYDVSGGGVQYASSTYRIEVLSSSDASIVDRRYRAEFNAFGTGFSLSDFDTGVAIDAAVLAVGDVVRIMADTIYGGLTLAGQTVGVVARGGVKADVVVNSLGVITLPEYVGQAWIGYKYVANMKTMRLEGGAGAGTAQGKKGRSYKAVLLLDQTGQGLYIGSDLEPNAQDWPMDLVELRSSDDPMDQAIPLFDGLTAETTIPGGFDLQRTIALEHRTPLPCSIVAIYPEMEVTGG